MYKYTIADHWKHYYKTKYYVGCRWYKNLPLDIFISAGWPDTYVTKYRIIQFLPEICFFSTTPLKEVPIAGYLIPVNFFKEEFVNEQ